MEEINADFFRNYIYFLSVFKCEKLLQRGSFESSFYKALMV